jgi:hypothetical protein
MDNLPTKPDKTQADQIGEWTRAAMAETVKRACRAYPHLDESVIRFDVAARAYRYSAALVERLP